MGKQRPSNHVYKGPLLRHTVRDILHARSYTNSQCVKEFDVGNSWLTELKQGRKVNPDKLQEVYEKLTGAPLITKVLTVAYPLAK